jgi:argininosuccinate synthase
VRFELAAYALNPDIKVIAPWREWDLTSRTEADRIRRGAPDPDPKDKRGEAPFSVDANLLHTSSEGKVLEDPGSRRRTHVYQRTVNPEDAPDQPEIEIGFEKGDPVSLDGRRCRRRKCSRAQRSGRRPTASAGSTSSRTASSA